MSPSDLAPADRIVFISDCHLPPERTARTDLFTRFLREVCEGAGRLFVLGDLFSAWVGPRHVVEPGHAAAFAALQRLAESGTDVTLLRGNRDFQLDRRIARRFGLHFVRGAWRGRLGGKTVRLSHGDELAEGDRFHKVTRALSSNFPLSTLVKAMPLWASKKLAGGYRWVSDHRHVQRNPKPPQPDTRRIRSKLEAGADLVIIGHWHKPAIEVDAFGLSGKTFIMLGECTETKAYYAEMRGDSIELRTFTGPSNPQ